METVTVTIISSTKCREVNPYREHPTLKQRMKYDAVQLQVLKNRWILAESSLREWEIENPFVLTETSKHCYKGRKASQTLTALTIGSTHQAQIVNGKAVIID